VKDVETVVGRHPAVAEVAIVALPDPRTGERACACIVLTAGSPAPTLAELAEFCTTQGLAIRRLPEQIDIVATMPRTPGGKIDKRALCRNVQG
jgi:cyclohexanecarboxylate-CoA ligase